MLGLIFGFCSNMEKSLKKFMMEFKVENIEEY